MADGSGSLIHSPSTPRKKPTTGVLFPSLSFIIYSGPEILPLARLYPNLSVNSDVANSIPPVNFFEGPRVVILMIPPVASPYCAGTPPVITVTCSIADCGNCELPRTLTPSI